MYEVRFSNERLITASGLSLVGQLFKWTRLGKCLNETTLGKLAFNIRVTDLKGERISFGKANGRFWSKIISAVILFFGFVMATFTDKKQALHDMIGGTLVAKKVIG